MVASEKLAIPPIENMEPGVEVPTPKFPLNMELLPICPNTRELAFVVPKFKTPLITESRSEPACRKKLPEVMVTLDPSSDNNESPTV